MSRRTQWSYLQARLHARHGERLDEGSWHALEASKSLHHFLDRSRTTALHRFTDRINAQMSSHAIEQILRAEWRRYVTEVAGWTTPAWQPAVNWIAHLPDLPVLDRLLAGDTPDWARRDPIFAPFANGDAHKRIANLEETPFAPLSPAADGNGTLAERWLTHWRTLWPQHCRLDCQWLDTLAEIVADHYERLAQASVQETSSQYRRDLQHALTRLFRRRSGTPVALIAHLALVALDLERLRGGIMRRRLFDTESPKRAA